VEVVVVAGKSVPGRTVIGRMDVWDRQKAESRKQKQEAKMDAAVIPVLMPQAGNSMEEGTIVKWRVKEGDRIRIDIPAKRLDLLVSENELKERMRAFRPRATVTGSRFLDAYARSVGPASRGALLEYGAKP